MTPVRIATVACNGDQEAGLAGDLSGRNDVTLVFRCVDRAETLAVIRGGDADALFIVGASHWLDGQIAEEAGRRGVRLVGMVADPLEAEQLRVLGAELAAPGASIEALLAQARSAPVPESRTTDRPRRGRAIAVWGPKGAPGKTSVAIELACEIASVEPETLLVDADTFGGDVAQLLAIVEELPTIIWAAHRASKDELGRSDLTASLRRAGANGPVVLPGVPRPDLWADISEFGWRKLMTTLRSLFRFVIYDIGFSVEGTPAGLPSDRDRDRVARVTVADADRVVAICRGDPVGLKSFLWAMEDLGALIDLDRVSVVANKVRAGDEDEVTYVLRKHLGKKPIAILRDRPADWMSAVEAGISVRNLKPSSQLAESISDLAAALGADVPARGFLTRLAGRR